LTPLTFHFYNGALIPVRIAVPAWAALRARSPTERSEWDERLLRRLPDPLPGCLWLHGSSVGEVALMDQVRRELQQRENARPLAGSCFTRSGRERLGTLENFQRTFYLPADFPGRPTRLLRQLQPSVLGLIETELWPNLIFEAEKVGVPVVLLNARLAPERMRRYLRLGSLYRAMLTNLRGIGCQSQEDRERFLTLGAPPERTHTLGNMKYDREPPVATAAEERSRLGSSPEIPWFVAGSTARGEDDAVLEAWQQARRQLPDLRLLLAPRHLDRIGELESALKARGIRYRKWSAPRESWKSDSDTVILLDKFGELSRLYAAADVAFVGGSLVPVGGHNVLEPAALGVPVLFGPHMDHARDSADTLLQAGAAVCVFDSDQLSDTVLRLLREPAAAKRMGRHGRDIIQRSQGALTRQVDLLQTVPEATDS
jgi:3-deoxy-D-manno-octulosonic-acid transferase